MASPDWVCSELCTSYNRGVLTNTEEDISNFGCGNLLEGNTTEEKRRSDFYSSSVYEFTNRMMYHLQNFPICPTLTDHSLRQTRTFFSFYINFIHIKLNIRK